MTAHRLCCSSRGQNPSDGVFVHPRPHVRQPACRPIAVLRDAHSPEYLVHLKIHVPIDWIGQSLLHKVSVKRMMSVMCSVALGSMEARRMPSLPHVFVVGLDIFRGDRVAADALFIRPLDDLVIDVGEVLDEVNVVAADIPDSAGSHRRRARCAHGRYGNSRRQSRRRHTCARSSAASGSNGSFFPVSVL